MSEAGWPKACGGLRYVLRTSSRNPIEIGLPALLKTELTIENEASNPEYWGILYCSSIDHQTDNLTSCVEAKSADSQILLLLP
jgi:hypothetical protein